ncbi:MAG: DsbC/DsbD-like thiol-disulfide interchange protein/cytochrome c biogenesis protein CcdA, partial [Bradymonadia bacterium]
MLRSFPLSLSALLSALLGAVLCALLCVLPLHIAHAAGAAGDDAASPEESAAERGAFARSISVPDSAFAEGGIDDGEARAETRLVLCAGSVAAGDELKAGVLFTLDPGWHVYWRNPGDSGMEPDFIWKNAATAGGDIAWPTPSMFVGGGGVTTYGYSDEVLLSMPIRIVASTGTNATIAVEVDYLVCDVGGCIPHNSTLRRDIALGPGAAHAGSDAESALFDHFGDEQPTTRDVEFARLSTAGVEAYDLTAAFIACAGPGAQPSGAACPGWNEPSGDAFFFPDRGSAVRHAEVSAWPHPGAYDGVVFRIEADPARLARTPLRVSGVLVSGDLAFNIDVELPSERSENAALWPVAWGLDPVAWGLDPVAWGLDPVADPAVGSVIDGSSQVDIGGSGQTTQADAGSSQTTGAAAKSLPLWRVLLFALLGGVLLNLMPCVLPVLALKVAGFASAAHDTRYHPAAHGAAYAGGVIGTMLALAGAVIALRAAGASVGWGFQFQEPAFVVGVAIVLTVFATNLFGVWEFALNSSRLDEMTRSQSGLARSVFEGILAVVVATPCSAPLLATA